MKLVLISDTHGRHKDVDVPAGDVLIHAGDCTTDPGRASLRSFLQWLEAQPHRRKILVAGNHDWAFEKWPDLARAMVTEVAPSVTYLQDSGCVIDGVRFHGSPVSPRFFDWAFNRDRGADIRRHWDMIPDDTDVLITHGPPHGGKIHSLDWVAADQEHVGCRDLYEAILRVRPALHVSGHIHGGHGQSILVHEDGSKTTLINASCCDEHYRPVNAPWVHELAARVWDCEPDAQSATCDRWPAKEGSV